MEFALTTLLLLPGVVSLAIATGRRNRAVAPRDLPAAIAAILLFALLNFALAALCCSLHPGVPRLGASVAALLTGETHDDVTRARAIASLFDCSQRNVFGFAYLLSATVLTGKLGAFVYDRLLQIIARNEATDVDFIDDRTWRGRFLDFVLVRSGITDFAIARGASYWLVIEQTARLLAKEPQVYADVTQGADSTLFAGQVVQVITSRSGETLSVVLKKAQRYRRNVYGEVDPLTGKRPLLKPGRWTKIGDSEAFYLRGDTVQNISYRIYGDPSRGGFRREVRGKNIWQVSRVIADVLDRNNAAHSQHTPLEEAPPNDAIGGTQNNSKPEESQSLECESSCPPASIASTSDGTESDSCSSQTRTETDPAETPQPEPQEPYDNERRVEGSS